MKRLLLALALFLFPSMAFGQCNGVFANGTVCGNNTGASNTPRAVSPASLLGAAGGTNGQIQYNNSGALAGFTAIQDCTITPSTGVVLCTKTNNVAFTTFATASGTVATAALNLFTTSLQGLVPASGGGTTNFLRADGTFVSSVTSVTCGTGLSGGTITTTGTCAVPNQVLLATLTASNSATLSDTTSLTATYSTYEIVLSNIVPATNSVACTIQVHSAAAFQTTTYLAQVMRFTGTTSAVAAGTTGISCSDISATNTVPGISGTYRIYNPSSTTTPKHWTGQFSYLSAGANIGGFSSGFWNANGAVDGFQVLMSAGNITSGTIKIYGIQ